MKKLLILLPIIYAITLSGCQTLQQDGYAKVGMGYKFQETEIVYWDCSVNNPLSARLEIGIEGENFSYGVSHHSQWLSGFPFNNDNEYSKTEIFVDYKFTFK